MIPAPGMYIAIHQGTKIKRKNSKTNNLATTVMTYYKLSISAAVSKATPGPAAPSTSTLSTSAAASTTKPPPPRAMPALPGPTSIPNVEAVKRAQELAAKMGLLLDLEFAPFINLFPGYAIPDLSVPQKPVKAPVLRLDALRREMDGHFLLLSYQMGAYLNFCSI